MVTRKGTRHVVERKTGETFPHPDKYKNFLDHLVYAASLIGPVLTLPQVWKIWFLQNAAGVSLISWVAYLLCAVIWLLYGMAHKEKPIIFANILWIVLDILIIIGITMYGSGYI